MKCTDVSTLLVDFLYEELPAAERREFLAHVESCVACSAEVKAMASTLGHARAALRGPLAEEPPPHLRARILQAAEASVAATAAETRRVGKRRPQPEGLFSRFWKTPWLVPALGAAGVATAVLLIRVIKNPQVLPEQKPAAIEMLAQPAAEPRGLQQAPQRPEAESKPAFPSPSAPVLAKRRTAESDDNSYAERKHAAGKPSTATRAPSNLGTAGRRFAELSGEPLGGAGERLALAPVGAATTAKGGFRAAAPSKAPVGAIGTLERAQATRVNKDETVLDQAPKSLAEGRSSAVGAGAGSSARWAEPPPPRHAAAPAALAAPPAAAALSPRPAEAAPVVFAATPAPAEPVPAKKAKRAPALEDQLKSAPQEPARSPELAKTQAPGRVPPASPAAQAEASADKKKVSENGDSTSLEERVRKAERLFAEKKWAEAAAAFRALIAQAPSNPATKTWRERLAAAEGAQQQGRAARAKKAVSSDPLDGL
jgi:anti-sigma factor RsiW